MTQEDKELLLKDLCARLPYNPLISINGEKYRMEEVRNALIGINTYKVTVDGCDVENWNIKPYLFPLSSMSEEQKHELKMSTCPNGTGYFNEYSLCCPVNHFGEEIPFGFMSSIIDYLNKNHFDYHGLIEKGLAIDASELNIY